MADAYPRRTLREITRIVASRFIGMVIIFAVVIVAVWTATHYAPKQYRSELPLLAEPRQPAELGEAPAAASKREVISLFISKQESIIKSRHVLASALLHLLDGKGPPRPLEVKAPGDKVEKEDLSRWEKQVEQWDEQVDLCKEQRAEYLRKVEDRVKVVSPGGPDVPFNEVFKIQVDWPEERDQAAKLGRDPRELAAERAEQMARYVLESYRLRFVQLEMKLAAEEARGYEGASLAVAKAERDDAVRARQEFIEGLDKELRSNLLFVVNVVGESGLETGIAATVRDINAEIENIKAEEKELEYYIATSISPQIRKVQELQRLEDDFDAAEQKAAAGELERSEADLKTVVDRIRNFSLVVPDDAAAASSSLGIIQDRATHLRLNLDGLTTSYKYVHESVRNTARELLNVWTTLGGVLADQQKKAEDKLGKLRTRREAKELSMFGAEGVEGKEQKLSKLIEIALKYEQLDNQVKHATQKYNEALEQKTDAVKRKQLAQTPILAIDMDSPSRPDPARPRRPILWLNLVIAVIAGLILAVIYAFMADHFDHTIKGIDDAERYLGAPVLVSIPKLGGRIVRTT